MFDQAVSRIEFEARLRRIGEDRYHPDCCLVLYQGELCDRWQDHPPCLVRSWCMLGDGHPSQHWHEESGCRDGAWRDAASELGHWAWHTDSVAAWSVAAWVRWVATGRGVPVRLEEEP